MCVLIFHRIAEMKRKSWLKFLLNIVKTQLYIINVESEQISFQKKQILDKINNTNVEDSCVVKSSWVDSRSRSRESKAYSSKKSFLLSTWISSRDLKFILGFRWIVADYLVSSKCFELCSAAAPSRSVLLRLRAYPQPWNAVIMVFAPCAFVSEYLLQFSNLAHLLKLLLLEKFILSCFNIQ